MPGPKLNCQHKSILSITEQLLKRIPGSLFPAVRGLASAPSATCKFEPFAIVAEMLVEDRFGAAVTALVRGTSVVAGAIEANAQIGAAFVAGFTAARLASESPFPAALMTMSGHERNSTLAA